MPLGGPRTRSAVEVVFGRRVREARKHLGLTQAQLADEVRRRGRSLDSSQVAKIEHGQRFTNIEEVVALSAALQVHPSQLVDKVHRWERSAIRYEAEGKKLSARRARLEADMAQLKRDIEAHRQEAEDMAGKLDTPRVSSLT